MAENEQELALRTEGNSVKTIQFLINLLPVLIASACLFAIYLLYTSLISFHKRPLRSSIAPILILLLRYVLSRRLPLLLEPAVNSSFPVGNHSIDILAPRIFIADLHTDTMLWTSGARSIHHTTVHPFTKSPIGSSDIPRMMKGGVGLQVFAAVISVPRGMNFKSNPEPSTLNDINTPKAILEWPVRTWASPLQRALYQAERLRSDAKSSDGKLFIIETGEDIQKLGPPPIGAVLAVEGMQALEGKLENIGRLHAAGYRLLGPCHFFDTEVGGSSAGVNKGGLTEFGFMAMEKMKQLKMVVDLAHSSHELINDITSLDDNDRPALLLSHTGITEICDHPRNYPVRVLEKVVACGGLIGIAIFSPAVCGDDLVQSFVRSVLFLRLKFGIQHVALGSDWDGAVHTIVDAANVNVLVDALRKDGTLSEVEIEQVMGGNVKRFLAENL